MRYVSVTDQWAQMAVAGPKSRAILQARSSDDLSDAAFPFMTARAVTLKGGLKARLYRISFSGELAYELGVPAGYGEAVADALMEAGRDAWRSAPTASRRSTSLRIEKGHVTHTELDGRVTADDVGPGRMTPMQQAGLSSASACSTAMASRPPTGISWWASAGRSRG